MTVETHDFIVGWSFFADTPYVCTSECSCGWGALRGFPDYADAEEAWEAHVGGSKT